VTRATIIADMMAANMTRARSGSAAMVMFGDNDR
jgi:hypothetical protein